MRPPAKILTVALEKISDPKAWVKNVYAADSEGEPISLDHPDAVCFCSIGATRRATFELYGEPEDRPNQGYLEALTCLHQAGHEMWLGFESIATFNDLYRTEHSEVVSLFKKAIELASVEPS